MKKSWDILETDQKAVLHFLTPSIDFSPLHEVVMKQLMMMIAYPEAAKHCSSHQKSQLLSSLIDKYA